MNNKVFVADAVKNTAVRDIVLDAIRGRLESPAFFDRYGDADLSVKSGLFGFVTVVPNDGESTMHRFLSMLRCSYVYLPCGWHEDRFSRKTMMWAELFGKRIIFEEDSRCK